MSSQSMTAIKGISTALISAALGLELWNLLVTSPLPDSLYSILPVVHGVLVTHAIEGLVAAVIAPSRQAQPLRYGVYTFFTGFPGLVELFEQQEHPQ